MQIVQILFSGKNKKRVINLSSAEYAISMQLKQNLFSYIIDN